jgi:hypothetical protein
MNAVVRLVVLSDFLSQLIEIEAATETSPIIRPEDAVDFIMLDRLRFENGVHAR